MKIILIPILLINWTRAQRGWLTCLESHSQEEYRTVQHYIKANMYWCIIGRGLLLWLWQLQLSQSKTKLKQKPHKETKNVNSLCSFILPGCLPSSPLLFPSTLASSYIWRAVVGAESWYQWTQWLEPDWGLNLSADKPSRKTGSNHQQFAPVVSLEGSCENLWALPAFWLHQSMVETEGRVCAAVYLATKPHLFSLLL